MQALIHQYASCGFKNILRDINVIDCVILYYSGRLKPEAYFPILLPISIMKLETLIEILNLETCYKTFQGST